MNEKILLNWEKRRHTKNKNFENVKILLKIAFNIVRKRVSAKYSYLLPITNLAIRTCFSLKRTKNVHGIIQIVVLIQYFQESDQTAIKWGFLLGMLFSPKEI